MNSTIVKCPKWFEVRGVDKRKVRSKVSMRQGRWFRVIGSAMFWVMVYYGCGYGIYDMDMDMVCKIDWTNECDDGRCERSCCEYGVDDVLKG